MTYPYTDKIQGLDVVKLSPVHWQVTIFNPLYGSTVALNAKFIAAACKERITLIVRVRMAPDEYLEEIVEAKVWRKQAREIQKYHNYADRPIVLYQREVRSDEEHRYSLDQLSNTALPRLAKTGQT